MGFKNSILKKVLNQDAKIQITNEFFKIFFLLKEKQIKRYLLNKIIDIIQEFKKKRKKFWYFIWKYYNKNSYFVKTFSLYGHFGNKRNRSVGTDKRDVSKGFIEILKCYLFLNSCLY